MARSVCLGNAAIGLAALAVSACVSQATYNEQAAQLEEARAQAAAQQTQIAKMQSENKWVMAGDLLFPEGGYQLSSDGEAALNQYVPQLRSLQNTKIVVYGYTDNLPVGPAFTADRYCQQCRFVIAQGRYCRFLPPVAGGQPEHFIRQRLWRDTPDRAK
jgi:hypothetical protein